MTDLQTRLTNGARTLSTDEQARLQRQGDLLSHEFQRKQDDLNEEVQAAQGDIVDTIGRKMLDVLDRYARENGLALVLDSSAQGSPVVYSATELGRHRGDCAALRSSLPREGGRHGDQETGRSRHSGGSACGEEGRAVEE